MGQTAFDSHPPPPPPPPPPPTVVGSLALVPAGGDTAPVQMEIHGVFWFLRPKISVTAPGWFVSYSVIPVTYTGRETEKVMCSAPPLASRG